jgi:hypothetical protein
MTAYASAQHRQLDRDYAESIPRPDGSWEHLTCTLKAAVRHIGLTIEDLR